MNRHHTLLLMDQSFELNLFVILLKATSQHHLRQHQLNQLNGEQHLHKNMIHYHPLLNITRTIICTTSSVIIHHKHHLRQHQLNKCQRKIYQHLHKNMNHYHPLLKPKLHALSVQPATSNSSQTPSPSASAKQVPATVTSICIRT